MSFSESVGARVAAVGGRARRLMAPEAGSSRPLAQARSPSDSLGLALRGVKCRKNVVEKPTLAKPGWSVWLLVAEVPPPGAWRAK